MKKVKIGTVGEFGLWVVEEKTCKEFWSVVGVAMTRSDARKMKKRLNMKNTRIGRYTAFCA
jgi:hypothetical protein